LFLPKGTSKENDLTFQPIRKLFTEYEVGRKSSADNSNNTGNEKHYDLSSNAGTYTNADLSTG